MRRLWLVAFMLAVGAAPSAAQAPDEPRTSAATTVAAQIEIFTGPVDHHCGIFLLQDHADGRPAANRKQLDAALRCVRQAQKEKRATWAIWQMPAIDATAFAGLAATATSAIHEVHPTGRGGDAATMTPCVRPRFDETLRIVCENTTKPLSASELNDALDKLERDVKTTAGKVSDGLVTRAADQAKGVSGADPGDPGFLAAIAGRVQQDVHDETGFEWPTCPRHFNHALELRDGRWFCERESAFIIELGRLRKAIFRRRTP